MSQLFLEDGSVRLYYERIMQTVDNSTENMFVSIKTPSDRYLMCSKILCSIYQKKNILENNNRTSAI